jgi:hypothetical protein
VPAGRGGLAQVLKRKRDFLVISPIWVSHELRECPPHEKQEKTNLDVSRRWIEVARSRRWDRVCEERRCLLLGEGLFDGLVHLQITNVR